MDHWCDRHWHEKQQREPAEGFRVADATGNLVELDLCQLCADELLTPLLQVVDAAARPVAPAQGQLTLDGGPATNGSPYRCPVCFGQTKTYASLTQHFKNHHGRTVGSMYGNTCPVCTVTSGVLGTHARRTHDVQDVAHLFELGQVKGDPHGVLRERKKLWLSLRG